MRRALDLVDAVAVAAFWSCVLGAMLSLYTMRVVAEKRGVVKPPTDDEPIAYRGRDGREVRA
jgi:hypothetical protein